jgi:integrase
MKGAPSKTVSAKIAGVRAWTSENGISLSELDKKSIRRVAPRKARPQTRYDFFSYEKLQAMLPYFDYKIKPLILCYASTGARLNELLDAKLSDLHEETNPVSIYLRDTKTGEPRNVYLTTEAYTALKKWLPKRENYLEEIKVYDTPSESGIRKNFPQRKKNRDDRIFPFSEMTIYRSWWRALDKADLKREDVATKRATHSIHKIRAWTRDRCADVVGRDYAEIFLGHRDQYDGAYIDMREETLQKKHLQCGEALTISSNKRIERDVKLQADTIREQDKTIAELQERLAVLETGRKLLNTNEGADGAMGIIRAGLTREEIRTLISDVLLENAAGQK